MKKHIGLCKVIVVTVLCIMIMLCMCGCRTWWFAELADDTMYNSKPIFKFTVSTDGTQQMDVNSIFYHNVTYEMGWKAQPKYYGEVIGYAQYYKTIQKIGVMQNDPAQNFLYSDYERGSYVMQALYCKDGVDIQPIGANTVSRIDYHVKGKEPKKMQPAEDVKHSTFSADVIKAFLKDFFEPTNVYGFGAEGGAVGEIEYVGDLQLYSEMYPTFYVPELCITKTDDNRYFIWECPLWWLSNEERFYVEISADVMAELMGEAAVA